MFLKKAMICQKIATSCMSEKVLLFKNKYFFEFFSFSLNKWSFSKLKENKEDNLKNLIVSLHGMKYIESMSKSLSVCVCVSLVWLSLIHI